MSKLTGDQQRLLNAKKAARVELGMIRESAVVRAAFSLTRIVDCEFDGVEVFELWKELEAMNKDGASDIAITDRLLGNPLGRKYAAAKLKHLAAQIELLDRKE